MNTALVLDLGGYLDKVAISPIPFTPSWPAHGQIYVTGLTLLHGRCK